MATSIKLRHINGDTCWLLSIALPSGVFNILIDPWLSGWQKDYSSYFSRQIHVIKPCAATIPELISQLPASETINAILVAHDFTDHCNFETLKEADPKTAIFAHPTAVNILKGWKIFDKVYSVSVGYKAAMSLNSCSGDEEMPEDVGVKYIPTDSRLDVAGIRLHGATMITVGSYYVVYSPHGVPATALRGFQSDYPAMECLALIHNFDQITIGFSVDIGGPLNMGPASGVAISKLLQPRRWIQTHDEMKRGEGVVAAMLHRRTWTAEGCLGFLRQVGVNSTEVLVLDSGEEIELFSPRIETS